LISYFKFAYCSSSLRLIVDTLLVGHIMMMMMIVSLFTLLPAKFDWRLVTFLLFCPRVKQLSKSNNFGVYGFYYYWNIAC